MSVIKVSNVSKIYNLYEKPSDRLKEAFSKRKYHKEFKALNCISFDVLKGECFGIIGTNGSGKSTILKIITGVLQPSLGGVDVIGKVSALLELGAGFNMEYTGLENIYMNGLVLGYSKDEVSKMVPKILEFADIGDYINQPVKLYSSGMFARLAFAVAINIDPDILIVDEALSVGDIFFQAKCFKKFDEFKELGKTIIFVSHDITAVLKYCDRVMLLNKGEVVDIGNPLDIVNKFKKILAGSVENDSLIEFKNRLPVNTNPSIYGNNKASIVDFGLFNDSEITNTFLMGNIIKIVIKVRFNEDVKNPIIAWKLKNNKGLEIIGTNTFYEGIDFDLVKANEEILVEFSFKCNLAANQYLLDLGVTRFNGDGLEVLCRFHEITTIDVLSDKECVGFVNPRCVVNIERSIK